MREVASLSRTSMYLYHLFRNQDYAACYGADGNYRILDSGVFELGRLPTGRDYARRIVEISPDEIVAPDIVHDSRRTLELTDEFARRYASEFDGIKIQGVVQASSINGAIDCYRALVENPLIDVIGLPSRMGFEYKGRRVGRRDLVKVLLDRGLLGDKEIHLLGLRDFEDVYSFRMVSVVRSCDTSKFYKDANAGISYRGGVARSNLGQRLDFSAVSGSGCLELLEDNMDVLRQMMEE